MRPSERTNSFASLDRVLVRSICRLPRRVRPSRGLFVSMLSFVHREGPLGRGRSPDREIQGNRRRAEARNVTADQCYSTCIEVRSQEIVLPCLPLQTSAWLSE